VRRKGKGLIVQYLRHVSRQLLIVKNDTAAGDFASLAGIGIAAIAVGTAPRIKGNVFRQIRIVPIFAIAGVGAERDMKGRNLGARSESPEHIDAYPTANTTTVAQIILYEAILHFDGLLS